MSNLLKSIDERTRLAGTNRLEVLLFSLGRDPVTNREEVFGINVFKVKEVMHAPDITRAPDMPPGVEGMVCLRGDTIPVINLQAFCGIDAQEPPRILIVTEYNQHQQGFLVHAVDSIKRMAWADVKAPPAIMANRHGGLVTAVSETDDHGLVMILDVEKVLADTAGLYEDDHLFEEIQADPEQSLTVLYADDSSIARSQIERTLRRVGYRGIGTENGRQAWEKLLQIAEEAELAGQKVSDRIQLVLTDVEMPELDGYVLTRNIKEDPRFSDIPVVMHSSLTTDSNRLLGTNVGADAYVSKFQPLDLVKTMKDVIESKKSASTPS